MNALQRPVPDPLWPGISMTLAAGWRTHQNALGWYGATGKVQASRMPAIWARAVWNELYVPMGVTIDDPGPWPTFAPNDRVLAIANHPATLETVPFIHALTRRAARPHLAFVARKLYQFIPFFGTAIAAAKMGMFINRASTASAKRTLRTEVPRVFLPGTTLVIFVDQSRWSEQKLARDRENFGTKIPGFTDWPGTTLAPRAGGVGEIMETMQDLDLPYRILDLTCGFDVTTSGWFADRFRIVGRTFHLRGQEATGLIPLDLIGRRQYLADSFLAKNHFLHDLRQEGSSHTG